MVGPSPSVLRPLGHIIGRRVRSDTLQAGPNITPGRGYRGGQPGRRSRGRPLVIVVLAGVVVLLRFRGGAG